MAGFFKRHPKLKEAFAVAALAACTVLGGTAIVGDFRVDAEVGGVLLAVAGGTLVGLGVASGGLRRQP